METLLCALELEMLGVNNSRHGQIISAWILLDPKFKQALLDSCGSPLCDPNDPVYSNALMSSRKMCAKSNAFKLPPWIEGHTQLTRGQAER